MQGVPWCPANFDVGQNDHVLLAKSCSLGKQLLTKAAYKSHLLKPLTKAYKSCLQKTLTDATYRNYLEQKPLSYCLQEQAPEAI